MKYLFVTIFYNRPEISKLYLLGLKRLQAIHEFDILICVSDAKSEQLCIDEGIKYFYYKNLPLGVKHNRLFEEALNIKFDYVIHSGDDNLMSNQLFEEFIKETTLNLHHYIRPKGLYFYDTNTKRGLNFNPSNTFGAFRVFSRSLIENIGKTYAVTFRQNVNQFKEGCTYEVKKPLYEYLNKVGVISLKYEVFNIWDNDINHGLDFSSETRIIEGGYKPFIVDLGEPHIIDVKSEQNIWKFEKYLDASKEVSNRQIFKLIGVEEVSYLESL